MTDWDHVVQRHGPFVYTTAWRILGDADQAEDVVEEVFRLARGADRARRLRAWGPVLRHLAAVRSLDRLRRGRQQGFQQPAETDEPTSQFRQALADLPCREAAVFSLRYFGDLTHEQIAEACQLTLVAVAGALHDARALLESLLVAAVPEG